MYCLICENGGRHDNSGAPRFIVTSLMATSSNEYTLWCFWTIQRPQGCFSPKLVVLGRWTSFHAMRLLLPHLFVQPETRGSLAICILVSFEWNEAQSMSSRSEIFAMTGISVLKSRDYPHFSDLRWIAILQKACDSECLASCACRRLAQIVSKQDHP